MSIKTSNLKSMEGYDKLHKEGGFADERESYEVVAALLKGKRAVDIGCGSGFIESICSDIIGCDFSFEALQIARANGAKRLIQCSADNLPFKENSFEVSVSFGVLEHIINQEEAISEMARISEAQIFIVHASLPYGLELIRKPILRLFGLKDQPVEIPFSRDRLKKLVNNSGLKIIFEGFWNYVDLRWLFRWIPYGIVKWPSHHLLITIKSKNIRREFTGEIF
ncbi:MAG: class I SAM-dependent methyltransferase [bacterium]